MATALAATGCTNSCESWVGTWRGTFTGTIEGSDFELSTFDFEVQIAEIPGWEGEAARIADATWLLGGGWAVEFSDHADIECGESETHMFTDTICFIRDANDESDVCDFDGSLSSSSGSGSGTWSAPTADDGSPTFTGSGTWSLTRDSL